MVRHSVLRLECLEAREVPDASPLVISAGPIDQGVPIARGNGRYDLQPSVLLDSGDTLDANANGIPDGLYKMWWLGRYAGAGAPDIAPTTLDTDDRIHYAYSENGLNWSVPTPVLKGEAGTNPNFTADDHLVGSPTVLKIGSTYTMFYEAYSTWVQPINRFFSVQKGDNWITNEKDLPTADYTFERHLGFAPLLAKAAAKPIYSGLVTYHFGKVNHYLSPNLPKVGMTADGSKWEACNVDQETGKPTPVFWLYKDTAPGRKPIYSFFDPVHSNTYATDDPTGEGVAGAVLVEVLGFAATALDGPDMVGSDQNRIVMATSSDGVNWTRFQGPARGGAIIAPQDELGTARRYDPHSPVLGQTYGCGYPSALVRDGNLELYFSDTTVQEAYTGRHIRMPLDQIYNANAWTQVRSGSNNPFLTQPTVPGVDLRWSPLLHRYFMTYINSHTPSLGAEDPNFRQSATLRWSDANPGIDAPPDFPAQNSVDLPSSGRNGIWGGILATGLGQTVDSGGAQPRTHIEVFFESYAYGDNHTFGSDIAHTTLTVEPGASSGSGTITGNVYNDLNQNKRRDPGEAGLAGQKVYHDANGNAQRDAGEFFTTTDVSGNWRIDLAPGYYGLRGETDNRWQGEEGANGLGFQIAAGTVTSGVLFGLSTSATSRRTDLVGVVRKGKTWYLAGDQKSSSAAQVLVYGRSSDRYLSGDWDGDGQIDLVVVRPSNGRFQWLIDTNRDQIADIKVRFGSATDMPFLGDWDGNGTSDPGVAHTNTSSGRIDWYLNPTRQPDAKPAPRSIGFRGDSPVVGDWNGDGRTDVGAVHKDILSGLLQWNLDTTGDSSPDIVRSYGLVSTKDVPVTGDWDGDGKTDLGVTRNNYATGLKDWYLDTNGDLFADIVQSFGFVQDKPIVGAWSLLGVS